MAPDAFYITYRARIGSTIDAVTQQTLYRYASYAQRWVRNQGAWTTEPAVNIPGALARTWAGASGERMFLTRDDVYGYKQVDTGYEWYANVTLNLLRQITVGDKPAAERLDLRIFDQVSPKAMVFDGDRLYLAIGSGSYYYGYVMLDSGRGVAVPTGAGASSGAGGGTADTGTATPTDTSDHLAIIDMSQGKLALAYDEPTGLTNLDLMGAQQNKLFVNLQGDGILVVDVTSATAPEARSFHRTLGWASGIEFAGTTAYVPAYYYGTYRLDLNAPGNM
jgi:hypothetical protein